MIEGHQVKVHAIKKQLHLLYTNETKQKIQERSKYCHIIMAIPNFTEPCICVVHKISISRLQQIVDLDEKNQILTSNIWLNLDWEDHSMIWNPEKYDNVKTIRSVFLLIGKHKTRGIHPVESEANKSLWRLSSIFGGKPNDRMV